MSEPAKLTAATIGCDQNDAYRECTIVSTHSRTPRDPSRRAGIARMSRVIGAPSTSGMGTIMTSTMCWIMCEEKRIFP